MIKFLKSIFSPVQPVGILRGSGNIVGDERSSLKFTQFNKVIISGATDVHVKQGKDRSVVVLGDDNIVPLILTDVIEDTLHIGSRASYQTRSIIRVSITVPDLIDVSLSGAADVVISNLEQDSVSLKVSGSGDVTATGRVKHLKLRTSGSGDIRAVSLQADTVEAKCSGSGDISTTALHSATLKATGSGDIKLFGKPANVNLISKGSGDVRIL
jgi:hypothetical protein